MSMYCGVMEGCRQVFRAECPCMRERIAKLAVQVYG